MAFALMGAMALSIVIPVTSRVSASAAATLKPNVYVSEYDTRKELSAAATDLDKEITAEGAVLLKNEDNALPLAEGSKVSIFGKASARYSYAGEFGAAGFKVNNILSNFYSDSNLSGKGADSQSYGNAISAGLRITLRRAKRRSKTIRRISRILSRTTTMPRSSCSTERAVKVGTIPAP